MNIAGLHELLGYLIGIGLVLMWIIRASIPPKRRR